MELSRHLKKSNVYQPPCFFIKAQNNKIECKSNNFCDFEAARKKAIFSRPLHAL